MNKVQFLFICFVFALFSGKCFVVTTHAENEGVSKVISVVPDLINSISFKIDLQSTSQVVVSIEEGSHVINSKSLITNGFYVLDFFSSSNNVVISFKREDADLSLKKFEISGLKIHQINSICSSNNQGLKNYDVTDFAGNSRVIILDKLKDKTYQGIGAVDYFPYGMNLREESHNYRYAYNTQEKEKEISESSYSAYFWQYDARSARRWNLDPKTVVGLSEYATFGNNPLYFTDHEGDSVDFSALYAKDKDGKLLHEERVLAFETWAKSETGQKFLLEHAQEGFELHGELIGVHFKAKEEGQKSKDGVDLVYKYSPDGKGDFTSPYPNAETGRLRIDINITLKDFIPSNVPDADKAKYHLVKLVAKFSHESELHGTLQGNRFVNLKKKNRATAYDRTMLMGADHKDAWRTQFKYNTTVSLLYAQKLIDENMNKAYTKFQGRKFSVAELQNIAKKGLGMKVD